MADAANDSVMETRVLDTFVGTAIKRGAFDHVRYELPLAILRERTCTHDTHARRVEVHVVCASDIELFHLPVRVDRRLCSGF